MSSAPDSSSPVGIDAGIDACPADSRPESLGLVNLGWVPWGRSWKRNQSMVYQLSQLPLFERTIFVNPRGVWIAKQFNRDEGPVRDRVRFVLDSLPRRHGPRIRVCSQWHLVPFKRVSDRARRLDDWIFLRMLRRYLGGRRFVLLNNHPNFDSPAILHRLMTEADLRIFDLSDDFVEYFTDESSRDLFRRNIEFCCANSDIVFAINDHVADKYRLYNPNTIVVPNSTNFANFHRDQYEPVPWLERIRARGGPVLGCTGIINRIRIDYELLEFLAARRPSWQFVFVGNADPSFLEIADRYENVHHHAQVPYDELPDWIHAFDAAIIPFRVNAHTAGNDLLKFHDYLAMGKSVVTTNTGGAWKFEGLVHIAHDPEGFLGSIESGLEPAPEDLVARRIDTARRNSWNFRARQIEAVLREHLPGVATC